MASIFIANNDHPTLDAARKTCKSPPHCPSPGPPRQALPQQPPARLHPDPEQIHTMCDDNGNILSSIQTSTGRSMFVQVKKRLPWMVGLPLRAIGLVWPMMTEALALLWWGRTVGASTILASLLLIGSYLSLSCSSNRLVFSRSGFVAAFVLIGVSLALAVSHLLSAEEVPAMLWVHVAFGVAWYSAIWIVRTAQREGGRSQ